MPSFRFRISSAHRRSMAAGLLCLCQCGAFANDAVRGIEQALTTAQQDKRGITVYVGGQAVGGAVTRVEPGQWVELRNPQWGRIVLRLDRIDGVAAP